MRFRLRTYERGLLLHGFVGAIEKRRSNLPLLTRVQGLGLSTCQLSVADKAFCSKVSIAAGPGYWAVFILDSSMSSVWSHKKSFGNLWEFSLSNMEDGYLPQALRFTLMLKLRGGSSPPRGYALNHNYPKPQP